MKKQFQAKNITDEQVLVAIRKVRHGPRGWANIWDVQEQFPDFPPKVVTAKLGSLVRRKVLDGCTCGCRGDFEILADRVG